MILVTDTIGILLLVVTVLIIFYVGYLVKTKVLSTQDRLNIVFGLPLLLALSVFIGRVIIISVYPYSIDVIYHTITIISTTLINTLLLVQIGLYIYEFIQYSRKTHDNQKTFGIVLLLFGVVLLSFVMSNLGIDTVRFVIPFFMYLLGILSTIIMIATGIAYSQTVKNYLSYRELVFDLSLHQGDEVTVFTDPVMRKIYVNYGS